MSSDLLKKKCVPCEQGGDPLKGQELQDYLDEVPSWKLNDAKTSISKEFKFQDFIGAINFVERVADIAEMEGHHPDIHVYYNKVVLELWTHKMGGLSENDFILAAKIDAYK